MEGQKKEENKTYIENNHVPHGKGLISNMC